MRDRVTRARVLRERVLRCAALMGVAALCAPFAASAAQEQPSPAVVQAASRARTLVEAGDGAAARTLLDSLVNAQSTGSANLAEALYWRATLSERVSESEIDWKRIAIEAPLSARTPDALVRLGELEVLRGRTASARTYFERVTRDFPDTPQRVKGTLWVARSWFDDRDAPKACAALSTLRGVAVPDGELRLQNEEMGRRCASVAANSANTNGVNAGSDRRDNVSATGDRRDSVSVGSTGTTGKAGAGASPARDRTTDGGRFSVQLAAYDTRAEADASVKRLKGRGIAARVDGDAKPFRVRVGRYETRAAANAELSRLKKAGQKGFVAEITP